MAKSRAIPRKASRAPARRADNLDQRAKGMVGQDGIVEGATRLFPPANNLGKGDRTPGTKAKGLPFYNPGMALNRDLSILLVAAEAARKGRELDVADALAGTGARSLRIAHEVQAPLIVHANDADPTALAAIEQGRDANQVRAARLRTVHGDAHAFLAARRYDVVDIDPYGSPMPFLDAAVRATRHDGLVCLTATDTGALAGTYPRACRRRYDAHHGLHAHPWRSEVGLRILMGTVVRSAARFDRVATPLLSVAHGHWMRVVARIEDGKRDADRTLRQLRPIVATPTGSAAFVDKPDGPWAGPAWSGALHDAATTTALVQQVAKHKLASPATVPLVALLAQEADAPAFWLVPDRLQKTLGPPPRRDRLIQSLRDLGHKAAGSHLDPQGVRTDADLELLRRVWSAASPPG